jgi:hypothetical protein
MWGWASVRPPTTKRVAEFNERTENVYEKKGQGQKVCRLSDLRSRKRKVECGGGPLVDRGQPKGLQNLTNEPRMSMKRKDKVKKSGR